MQRIVLMITITIQISSLPMPHIPVDAKQQIILPDA